MHQLEISVLPIFQPHCFPKTTYCYVQNATNGLNVKQISAADSSNGI
jgi:hypothetical protein